MRSRDWPGNVRELENVIERALILAPPSATELEVPEAWLGAARAPVQTAQAALRPAAPALNRAQPVAAPDLGDQSLEERERRHIRETLEAASWRIEGRDGAAARLGLHPSTLRSHMRKLGIARGAHEVS